VAVPEFAVAVADLGNKVILESACDTEAAITQKAMMIVNFFILLCLELWF
jgi:hypothetical protein